MNTIWIVEYGCSDLGEQDGFSAAFSTKEKAVAHAFKCAYEQLEEDPDEHYEVEADDERTQVNLRNADHEYANDWWTIREVPFDL